MSRGIPLSGAPSPRAQLCRACLQSRAGPQAAASQRRWVGIKVLEKRRFARYAWDERAEKIKAGEEQNIWDKFEERGFVKDVAGQRDHVRELMRTKRIGAYVGIDPTADSLHIGHLVTLMPLFWMYLHGYRSITLIGGSTAKIGDPTGRLKDREMMSSGEVTKNITKMHYQLKRLWVNVEERGRKYGYHWDWSWRRHVFNNNMWWNKLPLLEVLKRLGSSMRIGPMLSRDTVKRKLTEGDGMSFAEFTYPLLQGWDWWHLYHTNGVQMQIGGSDQYGNIVAGIDAVKICRGNETHPGLQMPAGEWDDPVGFTVPLLTDSSGAKFGKSAGNAIWLDPFQTKSFDLYGYFMRRPDADVEKLLKIFTFMPLSDIDAIMQEHNADPSKRIAHHRLAKEVVALTHGLKIAQDTEQEHRDFYGKGLLRPLPAAIEGSKGDGAGEYKAEEGKPTDLNNAPRIDMKLPESLIYGRSIGRILHAAGFAKSIAEGTRLASQGGAYIGGAPGQDAKTNKGMIDEQIQFTPVKLWFPEDTRRFIVGGKYLLLRKGKHNIRLIEVIGDEEWKESGLTYPGEPFHGRLRLLRQTLKALEMGNADIDRLKPKKLQEVRDFLDEEDSFEAKRLEAKTRESDQDDKQDFSLDIPPLSKREAQLRNLETAIEEELKKIHKPGKGEPTSSEESRESKLEDRS